jgi:hypothetical protein
VACGDAGDRALELNAFLAASRWYAAALDHLDPDDPARPRLLFRLGRARFHAEQAGGAQLAEARDGLLAAGDRESAAEAEAMLGKLAHGAGEGARGIEHGRRAAERFGFTAWQRHLRAERVLEDYWGGRWDAAEQAAAEFVAESEAGSRHYMEPVCRLVQGRIRLARGHLSAAAEDTRKVLESARMIEDPQMLNPALAFAAAVALRMGKVKAAEALANELLASLAEHDGALMGSDWPVDLAIVLTELGRGNELAELAATSRMPNLWLGAATAFATGDSQRAADLYAQIGSLPDEAFARLQAARQLLGAGRQAEGGRAAAGRLAFHRHVKASAHVREAELLAHRLMAI